MLNQTPRVRFAPSPTGLMHLGNVRTALMNSLYARAHEGTLIVRVEDTDPQRNFDPGAQQILADLAWLQLSYQEGPVKGGPYQPYFQSERTEHYARRLAELAKNNAIYRCFCTPEELDQKRERQKALRKPPRYDRTCHALSQADSESKASTVPFIWRIFLNHRDKVTISDLAHGNVTFEFKNFSDFPITRQDGSFTFMFANFVDDMEMGITHVLRGDDHLSNTAGQAALYRLFDAPLPVFWHLPILCNVDGKKLSKRDFGFSLNDLRHAGYLPQAIINYLGILGTSVDQEIMSTDQLAQHALTHAFSTSSQIKYDVNKLNWLNHKWINALDTTTVAHHAKEFIERRFAQWADLAPTHQEALINLVKTDVQTIADFAHNLAFFFETPRCTAQDTPSNASLTLLNNITASSHDSFINALKQEAKIQGTPLKEVFTLLRYILTGKTKGPAINDLVHVFDYGELRRRIAEYHAQTA